MGTRLKYRYLRSVSLIITMCFFCSCSEPRGRIGGPCEFQSYPGTADFTEIKPVTDGNEVYFDFTFADPTTTVNLYNNGKNQRFAIYTNDGWQLVFTNDWLNSNGVSTGVTVSAEFKKLLSGSCPPPGYISFPSITGASNY